jgi:hypothetical protein
MCTKLRSSQARKGATVTNVRSSLQGGGKEEYRNDIGYCSSLSSLTAPQLGAHAIKGTAYQTIFYLPSMSQLR